MLVNLCDKSEVSWRLLSLWFIFWASGLCRKHNDYFLCLTLTYSWSATREVRIQEVHFVFCVEFSVWMFHLWFKPSFFLTNKYDTKNFVWCEDTPVEATYVRFELKSNYGAAHTCLYQLRAHGEPLSDDWNRNIMHHEQK